MKIKKINVIKLILKKNKLFKNQNLFNKETKLFNLKNKNKILNKFNNNQKMINFILLEHQEDQKKIKKVVH